MCVHKVVVGVEIINEPLRKLIFVIFITVGPIKRWNKKSTLGNFMCVFLCINSKDVTC